MLFCKHIIIFFVCVIALLYPDHIHAITGDTFVYGKAFDKSTGNTIKDVMVYVGSGIDESERTKTNDRGEYKILIPGLCYLGVYKKGYLHTGKHIDLAKDKPVVNFELEKQKSVIQQVTVKGKVIEQIVAKGTKSENHYLKIEISPNEAVFIFDSIGINKLPNSRKWIGKRVKINGYKGIGTVGWQWDNIEGIYVEQIELVP